MSDVRSFSVLSPQDGESREESGRETPHYGVQPTDRSTGRRGIADCDNVAENKLGHDGGQTSRQRMERKPAFGQSRPRIPRRKWQCEKNLLRVAECECSPSVLRPSRITDYAKITMNQLPRAPPEQSRNSTSRRERDRDCDSALCRGQSVSFARSENRRRLNCQAGRQHSSRTRAYFPGRSVGHA